MRELLIVAKFKEKVKIAENTLGQLIASDEKVEETLIDGADGTQDDAVSLVKDETEFDGLREEEQEDDVTSYEEVEFLELNGQNESLHNVQIVTADQSDDDDDEFIDEIIEECSIDDTYILDTIIHKPIDNQTSIKVLTLRLQSISHLAVNF